MDGTREQYRPDVVAAAVNGKISPAWVAVGVSLVAAIFGYFLWLHNTVIRIDYNLSRLEARTDGYVSSANILHNNQDERALTIEQNLFTLRNDLNDIQRDLGRPVTNLDPYNRVGPLERQHQ